MQRVWCHLYKLDTFIFVDVRLSTIFNFVAIPMYKWMQTNDELTLTFTLPRSITKEDVNFEITSNHLELKVKDTEVELGGDLDGAVNTDASTWMLPDKDTYVVVCHYKR